MAVDKDELKALLTELLGGGSPSVPGPDPHKSIEQVIKDYQKFSKELKETTTKTQAWSKMLKGGTVVVQDVTAEIKKLDERIESMAESSEKVQLIAQRDAIKTTAAMAGVRAGIANFASTVGQTAVAATGKFVNGLQSGSSGFTLASDIMGIAADTAGSAIGGVGNAVGAVGTAMSAAKGPIKYLGMAAAVAGGLIAALGPGASKLAKFGIEVLSKEVEKSIKAYNDASASGAMFADGMTGLRNASSKAGLTVDQFASVLSKHSSTIGASGMGVTEGAKRIGGALYQGGDKMKRELLNLGYGFEEQAGLVAETMATMKGSTAGPLKATDAQIAEQTQKYADNLRIIAAVSGEDAKAKMEAVKKQANQLMFQQKLSEKTPEQQAAIIRAMGNMSVVARANFMDMVNFGTVVNKSGAAQQAMSLGLANEVQQSIESYNNNTMDDTTQRQIAAANQEQRKRDLLASPLAAAGAAGLPGLAASLSEAQGRELEYLNAHTPEGIKAAEAAVLAAKNTKDAFADVAVAFQGLKITMQDELTEPMKKFAIVAKEVISTLRDMVKGAGLGSGKKESGTTANTDTDFFRAPTKGELKAITTAIGGIVGAGAVGGLTAGVGAVGGGMMGMSTGYQVGEVLSDWFNLKEGKAMGGITSGPAAGFLEKLHGTEAVVPLPDGKTIPVALTSTMTSATTAADSSTIINSGSNSMLQDLLTQQLAIMKQTLDQSSEMLSSMNDSRSLQQQLLNVSY